MAPPAGAYASLSDVYRELSAKAFLSRPRPLDDRQGEGVDPTTGTITLGGHGYSDSDRVRLVTVGTGYVPIGATDGLPCWVLPVDYWRFQISLTQGGSPITFSDKGSGAWGIQLDPEPRLLAFLVSTAAIINECLTAHSTPLQVDPLTGAYPKVVVDLNARMAARRGVTSFQIDNAAHRVAVDRIMAMAAFDGDTDPPAQKGSLLGDWKEGKPIYPQPVDLSPTVADDAAWGNGRTPICWTARVM